MELYKKILEKSKPVDKKFETISNSEIDLIKLNFKVPKTHPRFEQIKNYTFSQVKLEQIINKPFYTNKKQKIFIIDKNVFKTQKFVQEFCKKNRVKTILLNSLENETKTISFLERLIKEKNLEELKEKLTIITIGGGLIINVGAYLSEKTFADLIIFPTTTLSIADGSGGKVRINKLTNNKAYKHFYKSFYEPNAIFLDSRFLNSLSDKQIKTGLVETIKHGLFQSPKLYDFLLNNEGDLFKNKNKLKKAIIWAANLKKICIEIDIKENENGSKKILRGGHDFSDKLEENTRLKIPHGIAVAIGIIKELKKNKDKELLKKAINIFKKFNIPYTLEQFKVW